MHISFTYLRPHTALSVECSVLFWILLETSYTFSVEYPDYERRGPPAISLIRLHNKPTISCRFVTNEEEEKNV